jgi:signal transduction histidine kinase
LTGAEAEFPQHEEDFRALRTADLLSLIAAPLLARGKLIGILILGSSQCFLYGPADLHLAEELAQRAALAVENARLYSQAQRAIRTREDVLAVVSHDLKNPVSTIRLVTHLIGDSEHLSGEKLREFIGVITRSVSRMDLLISDLLDFAKIESGTFSIEKTIENVQRVFTPIIEDLRVMAEAKRQRLEVDLPPDLPFVALDIHRAGQLMSNLLKNAVKFTPEGGLIRVSAKHEDDCIVVCVADTGPGIRPEDLGKVFDQFWQAGETKQLGTGLGVSIAKGIVDAHGGKIWAESTLGRGSSFKFTLRVADLRTLDQSGAA